MFHRLRPYIPIIAVITAVGVVHGPLLFMDGTYWDDWVLKQFILDRDFWGHFTLWKELGLPGFAFIYWIVGSLLPDPVIAHNAITFSLLIVIPSLVYHIARRFHLSAFESAIIAVAAGAYPALETTFVFNVTVYLLMLALLLAGTCIGLMELEASGRRRILLRVIAWLLFGISFQHSSLIVFFGGSLLLLGIRDCERRHRRLHTGIIAFVLRHLDYVLLPVLVWVGATMLFPRVAYYNVFSTDPHTYIAALIGFVSKGLLGELREILQELRFHPSFGYIGVVVACVLWSAAGQPSDTLLSKRSTRWILAFGFVLLACAILPYIVVGKAPRAHGYTTRHALLLAIPVGVLLIGFLRAFIRRSRLCAGIALLLLAVAFAGSTLKIWSTYALWQQRAVKDRSVIAYFTDHPQLKSVGTFIIEDHFPVTVESYRFYEWGGMLLDAWGETGRLATSNGETFESLQGLGQYHPHWREWYFLAGYPRHRCVATLTIDDATRDSALDTALAYEKNRFFGSEEEMHEFLKGATRISLKKSPLCR